MESNIVKRAKERCESGNIDKEYVMLLAREVERFRNIALKHQAENVKLMQLLLKNNDSNVKNAEFV